MMDAEDKSKPSNIGDPTPIELPGEVETELKQRDSSFSWAGLITIGTLSVIGTAGLLMPTMARAKGATVAAHLKWADRQAEIEAVIRAANSEEQK